MSKMTIIGAIASENGVTLFTNEGKSLVLPSESHRTNEILEAVLIPLAKREKPEIDTDDYVIEKQLEKASDGKIKIEDAEGASIIKIKVGDEDKEIRTNGALKQHIERAVYGKDFAGFTAFMESFAKVEHNHSADELLEFMRVGDLPIADDGSIVVYKFLDKSKNEDDVYVDKHTSRVKQRLGSVVKMPIANIDQTRTQCSTGLHVCSNRYGSYGNSVFLAKVQPEHVVAAPRSEGGKMRVSEYHLVALLPQGAYSKVSGKMSALEDEEGRKLVADVLAGDHVGVLEIVTVNGSTYENKNTPITVEAVGEIKKAEVRKGTTKNLKKVEKPPKEAKLDVKKIRETVKEVEARTDKKPTKAKGVKNPAMKTGKKAPVEKPDAKTAYTEKLAKAKELLAGGMSLRQVAKELKMCRDSLSTHLKTDSLRAA